MTPTRVRWHWLPWSLAFGTLVACGGSGGGGQPAGSGGQIGSGSGGAAPSSAGTGGRVSAPASSGGAPAPAGSGGADVSGSGGAPSDPTGGLGGRPQPQSRDGGVASGGAPGAPAAGGATNGGGGTAAPPGPAASNYSCSLMIGILATQEWYDVGFETIVDNSKWELIWVHSGFVELWANPSDPVWSTAINSPCAQNSTKPDRVVFVALNFDFTTLAEWLPPLTASVKNLIAKYPSAKRIELTSFIRAPGNNPCSQAPAKRSTIAAAQDQAMAMVAAANPGLVVVAPKFEAKSCNEFSSNPPHPTPAGATAWATMMGAYYK